ncbi:histone acethyltransferase-like protein [Strigomonas culicis]|uniref:Histone acethyltransferase-like protein n=1 Tax=Strigomonas culicis TaxID=28005 RepID=S9UX71_9TRYP|nr:histone acethyltransferase-like protein [Strigomonas culicis]|eukprot:EPY33379.1 histone acethyltransferase-like protein [Strigomonas culicis]
MVIRLGISFTFERTLHRSNKSSPHPPQRRTHGRHIEQIRGPVRWHYTVARIILRDRFHLILLNIKSRNGVWIPSVAHGCSWCAVVAQRLDKKCPTLRARQVIPFAAVVAPRTHPADDGDLRIPAILRDRFRAVQQTATDAAVLHLVRLLLLVVRRNEVAVDVQLPYERAGPQLAEGRLPVAYVQPQPQEAVNDEVVCGLDGEEDLRPLAALIRALGEHRVAQLGGRLLRALHLAAADALAPLPALLQFVRQQLPQVRHVDAAEDVVHGDVAYDAVEADPRVHAHLRVEQHVDERLHAVRAVLALLVPLLDDAEGRRLAGVDFPLVRLQVRRAQHVVEHAPVGLRRRAGQVGHQVDVHLEGAVLQQLDRPHRVLARRLAVDVVENGVVRVLDAQLDAGAAVPAQVHERAERHRVGARLQRDADDFALGGLIQQLLLHEGERRPARQRHVVEDGVRRVEEVADERLAVRRRIAFPRAAQHEQLHLVRRVPDRDERQHALLELTVGIELEAVRAPHAGLVQQVAARLPWFVGTVVAVPLAAELLAVGVRRGEDSHDQHAGLTARGLRDQELLDRQAAVGVTAWRRGRRRCPDILHFHRWTRRRGVAGNKVLVAGQQQRLLKGLAELLLQFALLLHNVLRGHGVGFDDGLHKLRRLFDLLLRKGIRVLFLQESLERRQLFDFTLHTGELLRGKPYRTFVFIRRGHLLAQQRRKGRRKERTSERI